MLERICSFVLLFLFGGFSLLPGAVGVNSAGALVLVNGDSGNRIDFDRYLKLYLDYFDIAYTVCDVAKQQLPADFEQAAILILGHDGVAGALKEQARARLRKYIDSGGGIFSFDSDLRPDSSAHVVQDLLQLKLGEPALIDESVSIRAIDSSHFITRLKGSTVERLFRHAHEIPRFYRSKWGN